MPIILQDFADADEDYIEKHNANNAALTAFLDSLEGQILASVGEGSQLLLDLWDRDGIVGSHSYVLDVEAYSGGASITIGRRPAPIVARQEIDQSIAFGTFASVRKRVTLTGDLVLNAAAIVTALPKTIFIGIPSGGTPQFFEDDVTPNVIYIYSMSWNSFNLTNFKRIGHILPAYPLIQAIAAAPRMIQTHDGETDFTTDLDSATRLVLPGAKEDNGIGVDGSMEVLGFYFSAGRVGDDGFNAPTASLLPTDPQVHFKVVSEGKTWTLTDFIIDAGVIPDQDFRKVNTPVVGDDRFVTTVRHFTLERTFKGPAVTSARNFIWGMLVRPLIGIAIPKDATKVDQV